MSNDTDQEQEFDLIDLQILRTLSETPMWKKRIHSELQDQCSVQTVGRRVDKLVDRRLLESTLIEPDGIRRDLIIGYTLTDHGAEQLTEIRRCILREVVQQETFADDGHHPISDELLLTLIADEFNVTGEERTSLEHYHREDLVTILMYYFSRKRVTDIVSEYDSEFPELVKQNDAAGDIFNEQLTP